MTREERFWAKVDRSGGPLACWLWLAGLWGRGYGQFNGGGRQVSAHRYAWVLANGQIPDGLCVLHTCDNPRCVNPAHLWLGTHADNMADRDAKGRQAKGDANGARTHPERMRPARGEANRHAKLVAADIPVIRARCAAGELQHAVAADYGVSRPLISGIAARKLWGHIP